jgi:hypothetical protein
MMKVSFFSGTSWSGTVALHGQEQWHFMVRNSGTSWSGTVALHGQEQWHIMVRNSGTSWSGTVALHGQEQWHIMVRNSGTSWSGTVALHGKETDKRKLSVFPKMPQKRTHPQTADNILPIQLQLCTQ